MFFFDGSSNRAAGPKHVVPTNVFRLNQALTYGVPGLPQITFYMSGVGTRGDIWSAATGGGFDEIVIEAFINLASNYIEGDSIYLFGFSRGAAAARALSGLISDPGLLSADGLDAFPELWTRFVHPDLGEAEREWLLNRLSDRLLMPKPQIEFVGAFDTVAGSSWDHANLFSKVRFQNLTLGKSVKCAVQVLSIDDNRSPSFSPLMWERAAHVGQCIEQIWVPGVHADIGGSSDGRFLGNIALLTMIDRIQQYCPELEWDNTVLNNIVANILDPSPIEITSERPGLLRKLLGKASREIGRYQQEYWHPIYEALLGQNFRIRGRQQRYQPDHLMKHLPLCSLNQEHLQAMLDGCAKGLAH